MKPEDKVCTLEQAKRLVELGVVLDTEKRWCEVQWFHTLDKHDWVLTSENLMCRNYVPAPDVAELGVALCGFDIVGPVPENKDYTGDWWFLSPSGSINLNVRTEAQARAAAIIWLIENGYIKQ